jgi:segregation and condensation protein A
MRADAAGLDAGRRSAPRAAVGNSGAPELRLGLWEGPLDLLLELARAGRVDLARLSILDAAEQSGAALEEAAADGRAPLSRLADWLVMAAHLALLRSRLLLPADGAAGAGADADPEGEALRRRLADREHARRLADWLERRHQLGRDVFARGMPATEQSGGPDKAIPAADTAALFRACLAALEREHAAGPYRPEPLPLWRVPDALARLRRLLPAASPEGAALESFLPDFAGRDPAPTVQRRAALASTLLAGLELEREGSAKLSQTGAFGPVRVTRRCCTEVAEPAMAPAGRGFRRRARTPAWRPGSCG